MKLAIVGSRDFNDYGEMKRVLSEIKEPIDLVISGGAQGADSLAQRWAQEKGIPFKEFPADWLKYGKAAGPIRNTVIVENCDFLVSFRINGSKGTTNSINTAIKQGKKVIVKDYVKGD